MTEKVFAANIPFFSVGQNRVLGQQHDCEGRAHQFPFAIHRWSFPPKGGVNLFAVALSDLRHCFWPRGRGNGLYLHFQLTIALAGVTYSLGRRLR